MANQMMAQVSSAFEGLNPFPHLNPVCPLGFNYPKRYPKSFYIEEDSDCEFLLSVPTNNYSYLEFR
jgi:hypothetical protein